jgi:methylated-DNA-[protein]-cysteine S-methyltransferase
MDKTFKHTIVNTQRGWFGALSSPRGLVRTTLPQPSRELALESLGKELAQSVLSPEAFGKLVSDLQLYFTGKPVVFSCQLDFSDATPFHRQVWETTCEIPHGETRSYAWVAREIGRPAAARAVGQALGKNPLPIVVPCHRVIASDGSLCGFGGGLEMKKWLLDLERR